MRIQMRIFLMIAAWLAAAAAIRATTLARLSLDQLSAAADGVARVRCVAAASRWENGEIWTVTRFAVVETMKGALPAEITVRLPGGRVGHLTATVDGAPRFHAGEEAVLFLERYPAGLHASLEAFSIKVEPGPNSVGLQVEPGPHSAGLPFGTQDKQVEPGSARAAGFSVAGWVEGTFRISRDPRTGRETVTQDSSAFAVFDPATRAFRTEGVRRMPIEQFRERVAAARARAQENVR